MPCYEYGSRILGCDSPTRVTGGFTYQQEEGTGRLRQNGTRACECSKKDLYCSLYMIIERAEAHWTGIFTGPVLCPFENSQAWQCSKMRSAGDYSERRVLMKHRLVNGLLLCSPRNILYPEPVRHLLWDLEGFQNVFG